MFGFTRIKSVYPCGIQQDEWYTKFCFRTLGEKVKKYILILFV